MNMVMKIPSISRLNSSRSKLVNTDTQSTTKARLSDRLSD
jgi:hypothetical protein